MVMPDIQVWHNHSLYNILTVIRT